MTNAPQISTSVTPSIATTTDGTSTVTLLSVPFHDTTGGQAITFDVVGYDFVSSGGDIASAKISVRVKNVGGTLTMVGTPVHIVPIMAGSSTALQSAVLTAVVSGSNVNLNVIGVTGKTIKWVAYANSGIEVLNSWTAVPTPGDGYVNIWSAANTRWEPTVISSAVSGATIAGDVTGTLGASSVVKIQGTSVSATAPTNGQILQLVTGGWTPTTIGGDVTGSPSASTVAKIQGRAVSSAAPSDGYAMLWSVSDGYWKMAPLSSGTFAPSGDLSGTGGSQTVIGITGQYVSGYYYSVSSAYNSVLASNNDKHFILTTNKNSTVGYPTTLTIAGQENSNGYGTTGGAGDGGNVYIYGGRASGSGASSIGGAVHISPGSSAAGNSVSGLEGYVRIIGNGITNGGLSQFQLTVASTSSASSGGGSALPANPEGYITVCINGVNRKIPYYAT